MRQRSGRFWLVTTLMSASFLAGSWIAPRIRVSIEPGGLASQAAEPVRAVVSTDEPVARAAQVAGESVVNIDTRQRVVEQDWFGRPYLNEGFGSGSGVIVDPEGIVITNEHVVANASEIQVTLSNGKPYRGKVLGVDHETDVAVVKVLNAPSLPAAQIGDSRRLVPGQWAIAIGNPLGYQQTVTVGVVGNTGRSVEVEDRVYKSLIQTDAAINPGNSGGPLVDINGRVIGINTIVRTDAQGIGFAIPIHEAKALADELVRHGKIKRPWTGLNTHDVDEERASYFGLSRLDGAFVDRLDRRGPAWRAGIRPGDVIREMDGKKVRTKAEADAIISAAKIGDKLSVTVEREGELLKGEITVAEKP
jgi:serine protease Do